MIYWYSWAEQDLLSPIALICPGIVCDLVPKPLTKEETF